MHEIQVAKREKLGKASKALIAEGKLPGVFYGKKEASTPIEFSRSDFEQVWKEAGESSVITLTGLGENVDVLIHDVKVDPVLGHPTHIDFYAIEKGKKVEVAVSLEFVGVSPAEKELGGVLVKVLHEIEIAALPTNLPQSIEADISGIKDFETQLHAGHIKLPEGVELVTGADEVVALVSEAKEEEEEAPAEGPDMDSIEVEQKGKKEEAEGEGEKE